MNDDRKRLNKNGTAQEENITKVTPKKHDISVIFSILMVLQYIGCQFLISSFS